MRKIKVLKNIQKIIFKSIVGLNQNLNFLDFIYITIYINRDEIYRKLINYIKNLSYFFY